MLLIVPPIEILRYAFDGLGLALAGDKVRRHLRARRIAKRDVTWDEIDNAAAALVAKIEHKVPDAFIGLGRGGAVAAALVSTKLHDKADPRTCPIPIYTLDRVYLGDSPFDERSVDDIVITGLERLDVYGKSVIVVSGDVYSGNTLDLAKQLVAKCRPRAVQSACLLWCPDARTTAYLKPDLFGIKEDGKKGQRRIPWRAADSPYREPHGVCGSPVLVILHGLVGTGKTSVANAIARDLGYAAIHSDDYWFHQGLEDRAINPATNARHYDYMATLAISACAGGKGVVLDTTARKKLFRDQLRRAAQKMGVPLIVVRCTCSHDTSLQRIAHRLGLSPHELGTSREFDRINIDFQSISNEEGRLVNLVEIDTERLTCKAWPCADDVRTLNALAATEQAILGYLDIARQGTTPAPSA